MDNLIKSYIEIKVPISWDEPWFQDLREELDGVNIRWQRGYYHITMAFLDKTPQGVDLLTGLNRLLQPAAAPTMTFDRLDAFATSGGRRQVIYLTTSDTPAHFLTLVEDIPQCREIVSSLCRELTTQLWSHGYWLRLAA